VSSANKFHVLVEVNTEEQKFYLANPICSSVLIFVDGHKKGTINTPLLFY
jgi:hypothetical protein